MMGATFLNYRRFQLLWNYGALWAPLRANLTSANYIFVSSFSHSSSHFSPNKASSCGLWDGVATYGPWGCAPGSGCKMAAPRLFEAGALKQPRVWSCGIWSCRAWSWRGVFKAAAFDVAEDVCKFETDFNIVRR